METKTESLGIYGGTFSPIHEGHVRAAHAFLDAIDLDKLLIMPTATPPHKDAVEGATAEQRLTMARLAFEGSEAYKSGKLEVSDFEISREGKSYTVYTLRHFTKPNRKIYLLMGTDMFLTLSKWYQAEEIMKLAEIVLMRRERDSEATALIEAKRAEYTESFGARVHIIDEPCIEVSSTELREMLLSERDTGELIPDAVVRYIKENNLY